jgi:hypothetical protein
MTNHEAPEAPSVPARPPATDRATPPTPALPRFDPVALSGTTNALLANRLASQVAGCQRLPPGQGRDAVEHTHAAVAALQELAPANAVEGLLATQMVAAHNTSLDLLRRAMAEGQAERGVEACTRQYARLAGVFLKQLDHFVRQRGRQRQTIRIEHVRVVEDGKVTVRQEEERVR